MRDSGFRNLENFLSVESGIWENFACGIRIPGLWNLEYSSQKPEFHALTIGIQRLEFGIHGVEFSTYGCLGFPRAKSFIALNLSYLLLLYLLNSTFANFALISRTRGSAGLEAGDEFKVARNNRSHKKANNAIFI